MTCRYVRRHTADLFDPGAAPEFTAELRRHLAACPTCAAELEAMTQMLASLKPPPIRASADFKERTMNKLAARLAALQAADTNKPHLNSRVPRLFWRFAFIAAAIVALIVGLPYLGRPGGSQSAAMTLLAQSVQAASNLQSVHLIARMRTLPGDNFELIGTQYDFVPLEMWKEFGNPPRWRVEKPGRVVVMDGASSLLLFRRNQAVRGGPNTGFVDWLKPLLDADKVLEKELAAAQKGESQVSLAEQTKDGARRLVLTVVRKAQGDFTNDWCRNKSIIESDHTRLYTFDAASHRLTGLQVLVHSGGAAIPVLEVTGVRYNEPFDPALFTVALPEDVAWAVPPEEMRTTSKPLPTTPREAAAAFLEGMAREDWDLVLTVMTQSSVDPKLKQYAGGLQVIYIGEPFRSGRYPGWFVPYEARLRNGKLLKHALAVRNDNPSKRFHFDGGF
ncbi:MAG: hypothetical protein KJZ78_15900 [Bryobacteraceae bacterium]|nr:hypothetical protein [Bryobacteraceae bacterium]